jgi:hypothetical protein
MESREVPAAPVSAKQLALCGAVSRPAHGRPTGLGRPRRASDIGPGAALPRARGGARVPRLCVDRSAGAVMGMLSIPGAAAGRCSAGIARPYRQHRGTAQGVFGTERRATLHFVGAVVSKKGNSLPAFY